MCYEDLCVFVINALFMNVCLNYCLLFSMHSHHINMLNDGEEMLAGVCLIEYQRRYSKPAVDLQTLAH
jgi:hypothetical protein